MLTDQAIDDACAQAGIGRRTLESRQRDPDTVRRRVRPQVAARFRAWCKARGMSQGEAFSTWALHLIW
jgi:hypothetical protein